MTSPDKFFRSTGFRLLAWYAGIFALSVGALFGMVYWIALAALDQQLSDSVEREQQILVEVYHGGGRDRLVRAINRRVADLRPPRRYYLLQDAAGQRIAGNLFPMQPVMGTEKLPINALFPNRGSGREELEDIYPVVVHGGFLKGGEYLMVGENHYRAEKAKEAIIRAFGWGVAIMFLLAAAGGVALVSGFLRRIEAVNRTTRSIIDGDLSRRVPTRSGGDEMDQLGENLNAMLDRNQLLMESLKQVSDDIAHDLRTPLSRLRHRLEAARGQTDADWQQVIEQSIAELDAILETFSALLRIGQIESGARRAAFSEVDLRRIVAAVAEAYAAVAEDRGQQLAFSAEVSPVIHGDRELLTQMVANLVENSISHCPSGARISVTLDQQDGRPLLGVADSGPGIPEAERDKVLRRFYRLESSRTTPGNGLGLALVKAVAELHEADVELSDNLPGLRVAIRFPAAAVGARVARA